MSQVVYYVAMSLDGFIADDAGGVAWLDDMPIAGQDLGYEAFYDTVGAVILGSTTYEQILGFGKYPYQGIESVVMTKRDLPQPDGSIVTFSQDPLTDVITDLKTRHDKAIWLVGGGTLAAAAEDSGLIDLYDITMMPVLLRQGIPLLAFSTTTRLQHLHSVAQHPFQNGIVRVRFVPERKSKE